MTYPPEPPAHLDRTPLDQFLDTVAAAAAQYAHDHSEDPPPRTDPGTLQELEDAVAERNRLAVRLIEGYLDTDSIHPRHLNLYLAAKARLDSAAARIGGHRDQ